MRTHIIVGFIAVGLSALAAHASHASIVSANWDITNNTGQDAFDFHVVVDGPTTPPTDWVNGAFGQNESGPGPMGIFLKWNQGTVPNTKSTHVGVEFDSEKNEAKVVDAYWTDADKSQIGDPVPLPGFEAHSLHGDPQTAFSVLDDTDTSLVFHNLQFQTRLGDTPLDQLIPYTLPGFGPSIPDFTLLPGQSMEFTIDTGADDFVLAQMITYDPSDPADTTVGTVFQHQIPETSTWAMMLFGFAGLAVAGYRARRRSTAAA